jgi:hypothetical protein
MVRRYRLQKADFLSVNARKENDMKIYFQGLIVHAEVGDEKKQVAVLMKMEHHAPLMTVNRRDFRQNASSPPDGDDGDNGTVYCFGLDGRVTTDLAWGTATGPLTNLPKVRRLKSGGGDIDPDVPIRLKGSKFAAFVDLPAGSFSVKDYYEKEIDFQNVHFGCLPRTVTYEFAATSDVTFTIEGGKTVVLAPDAEIYITNRQPRNMMKMGSHYEAYKNFFKPPATSIVPPVGSTTPCPMGSVPPPRPTCVIPRELEVDCSNTRFP